MSDTFPNADLAEDELRYAIAELYAERPPAGLDRVIMDAAMAGRPAGRPANEPALIGPVEAFKRSAASLDDLLASLTDTEWRTPALRGLDVQGLIGHLIGVERAFSTGLATEMDPGGDADHIASTQGDALAQVGRATSSTYDEWRTEIEATIAQIDRALPQDLEKVERLHGMHLPLGALLIARTFELWTHAEDIRSAIGRSATAPDDSSLALMTGLAMDLIPFAVSRTSNEGSGRLARIVLTGPGGGTWQTSLDGPGHDGQIGKKADVRIVLDAVDFCRLVANRIDPSEVPAVVTGDGRLAEKVFAGAATLALD